jgi:hypothetical protein
MFRHHAYHRQVEADEVAEILRAHFDIPAVVFETSVDEGATEWWVEINVPAYVGHDPMHLDDPLDLDTATDGIESHWDRERDDREDRSHRGARHDFY